MNTVFLNQGDWSYLSSVVIGILSDLALVPNSQIDIDSELSHIGIDSLKLVITFSKLCEQGINVSPADFMLSKTVKDIITLAKDVGQVTESQNDDAGSILSNTIETCLLPGQSWFLNESFSEKNRFNISFVYTAKEIIDSNALILSAEKIHAKHLSLNKQFKYSDGKWISSDGPKENRNAIFEEIDLVNSSSRFEELFSEHCDRIQSSIDIESGVLFKLALFRTPQSEPDRVLIVIHHLGCDGFSLSILRSELWSGYDQAKKGIELNPTHLPEDNIVTLIEKFDSYRSSQDIQAKISLWRTHEIFKTPYLPKAQQHTKENNLGSSGKTKTLLLTRDTTDKLVNILPRINEISVNHILVAALNNVLCDWSKNQNQIIMMVDSGRTFSLKSLNFDASSIVSWLALTPPLVFKNKFSLEEIQNSTEFKRTIDASYENGIAYELGYFINNTQNDLPKITNERKVVLNFLGNRDIVPAPEEKFAIRTNLYSGIGYSPNNDRACIFIINAMIIGGQLKIDWNYNGDIYEESLIEELTQGMNQFIKSIIGCFSL